MQAAAGGVLASLLMTAESVAALVVTISVIVATVGVIITQIRAMKGDNK